MLTFALKAQPHFKSHTQVAKLDQRWLERSMRVVVLITS